MQVDSSHEPHVHTRSEIEISYAPKGKPPRLWELMREPSGNGSTSEINLDLAALELELRQQCQQSNWAGVTALWHQVVVTKHKLAKIGKLA